MRVVNLSSLMHTLPAALRADQRWTSLEKVNRQGWPEAWGTIMRYSMSKTGNILLTNELEKLTRNKRISNLSVHPGVVNTEVWEGFKAEHWYMSGFLTVLFRLTLLRSDQGALTQLYAASSPEIDEKNLRGSYLVPFGQKTSPWGDAKDQGGARSAELYSFIRDFLKEKVQVDLDQLVKQAGLSR